MYCEHGLYGDREKEFYGTVQSSFATGVFDDILAILKSYCLKLAILRPLNVQIDALAWRKQNYA